MCPDVAVAGGQILCQFVVDRGVRLGDYRHQYRPEQTDKETHGQDGHQLRDPWPEQSATKHLLGLY